MKNLKGKAARRRADAADAYHPRRSACEGNRRADVAHGARSRCAALASKRKVLAYVGVLLTALLKNSVVY